MPELELYLKRILEISPDLVIERAGLNREGLLRLKTRPNPFVLSVPSVAMFFCAFLPTQSRIKCLCK